MGSSDALVADASAASLPALTLLEQSSTVACAFLKPDGGIVWVNRLFRSWLSDASAAKSGDLLSLDCILDGVALALFSSTAGAVSGTLLAGHLAGDEPSVIGAVLGSVVGGAVGLGVVKLLEESNADGGPVPILSFSVSPSKHSMAMKD